MVHWDFDEGPDEDLDEGLDEDLNEDLSVQLYNSLNEFLSTQFFANPLYHQPLFLFKDRVDKS